VAEPTHPAPHAYLSTACHHTLHDNCRQVCKYCPAECACGCHTTDLALAAPTGAAPMSRPTREQVRLAITGAYIARRDAEGYAALTNDDILALAEAVVALLPEAETPSLDEQLALVESWGWQRRTFYRPDRAQRTYPIITYIPPTDTPGGTDG